MNIHHERQFLLVFQDGPLGKLITWLKLDGCSYRQIGRRVLFWISVVWLPPVVLSGVGAVISGEHFRVDILNDLSFHVRGLISIPLLISFECRMQQEFRGILPAIISRRMFRPHKNLVVTKIIDQIRSLQTAFPIDALLVVFSLVMVSSRLYIDLPEYVSSWRTSGSQLLLLAQLWGRWISMTAYYFIVFRWMWRFFVWSYFLLRLALLNPALKSLHPDRVGGLAFLLRYHKMFGIISLAVSSAVSANISMAVLHGDVPINEFTNPLLFYLFVYNVVLAIPLFFFTGILVKSRNHGLVRYARFGNEYAEKFDQKWLRYFHQNTSSILGVPDIQSLNDLHGSYRSQAQMRITLMDMRTLTVNTVFITAPLCPLILFRFPIMDLMMMIAKYFFKI